VLTSSTHFSLHRTPDEYRAGRLELSLVPSGAPSIPDDVFMASTIESRQARIFIAARHFEIEPASNITPQIKNDFILALVHEIVHLQHGAPPAEPDAYALEESRVWRDVNRDVVRRLRAQHQPIAPIFSQVDDALLDCHDEVPCPALGRLVRLTSWTKPEG
jgi:hypothetical protein